MENFAKLNFALWVMGSPLLGAKDTLPEQEGIL